MKKVVLASCFVLQSASAAPPAAQVVASCLQGASTPAVRYTDLAPAAFTVEDDEDSQRTSITLRHGSHRLGMWESANAGDFGLVYDKRYIPSGKIRPLGADLPSSFTPYTAQWGSIRHERSRYVCINFTFPGLGGSGSFQNVRGMYLIDITGQPKAYYAVGDVREGNAGG